MQQPPAPCQYWLAHEGTAIGPFTAQDLYSKLTQGEISWESMVCPVGQAQWLPMKATPTLAPPATVVTSSGPSPASSSPPASGTTPGRASNVPFFAFQKVWWYENRYLIGFFGVLVIGVGAWFTFSSSSSGPVEVCYRYFTAKSFADLRQATTPNLHPILKAMFPGPVNNLGNNMRFIDQSPAPKNYLGYFIGFYFDDIDDKGNTVALEGVFNVIDTGEWKIQDIYIVSLRNRLLDKPVSMAHDYWPMIGKEVPATSKMRQTIVGGDDILKWFNDPEMRQQLRKYQSSLTSRGWLLLVSLGIAGMVGYFRKPISRSIANNA